MAPNSATIGTTPYTNGHNRELRTPPCPVDIALVSFALRGRLEAFDCKPKGA